MNTASSSHKASCGRGGRKTLRASGSEWIIRTISSTQTRASAHMHSQVITVCTIPGQTQARQNSSIESRGEHEAPSLAD